MYTETTELTYSHQDLGPLNEFGLMCLFGSMHSKALVQGRAESVEGIRDAHGRRLYPAYFHTHLVVPETCPLSGFAAWRPVQLGVDVQRFGKCYLESRYVLKPGGVPAPAPGDFVPGTYPTMHGHNLFIVDVTEDAAVARQLAVPDPVRVAALQPVAAKPAAIQRAKEVARERTLGRRGSYPLTAPESIAYPVVPGRDVAAGHAMIFARFCQVMDYAEHVFLAEHLAVAGGLEALATAQLLEREIFYFNNAAAGDTLEVGIRAAVSGGGDGGPAWIETEYQVLRRADLALVAVAYAKKKVAGGAGTRSFAALAARSSQRPTADA